MLRVLDSVQYRTKETAKSLSVALFKALSGAFWGLVLAMIFQQVLGFGAFSFAFVIVSVALAFMRLAKSWSVVGALVFNVILVLLGLLLRLYILVAPGS